MGFGCANFDAWKEALSSYSGKLRSLFNPASKPDLIALDEFYRRELPGILRCRKPLPHPIGTRPDHAMEAHPWEVEELSSENQGFTPSDVERSLWSSAVDTKLKRSPTDVVPKSNMGQTAQKKRTR